MKKQVIAYLHTHYDPEWYRTIEDFNVRLVKIFDKVLLALKNSEIPSFYFDGQTYALINYLKFRPKNALLVKKLIKENKLFIGPFFVLADSFLCSGASLIKNLEFGIEYSKKMGEDKFIGYLADTFGHSKGIFEILKLFKIQNAIVWRGAGSIPSDITLNGVKTTRLCYGYYQDILHSNFPIEQKTEILNKILDKIGEYSGNTLLLPLGGDHLGAIENPEPLIDDINKRLKDYKIKLSNPFEYISKTNFIKNNASLELLDNSITYILSGVYSTRIKEKIENAKLQYNLFYKAQVLNYFFKNPYKNELDAASIELIKNHAHDSIYGCSTDVVSKQVKARQLKVHKLTDCVIKNLIQDFKNSNLIKNDTAHAGVFNFSQFKQGGIIEFISDKKIKNAQKIGTFNSAPDEIWFDIYKNPMTEDFHRFYKYIAEIETVLPPFSFSNVELKVPKKAHSIENTFIENEFLKLFIQDNKIHLINKKNKKLYKNFIEIHSTKDEGDSYNYAPSEREHILHLNKTKIKTKGIIKSTLEAVFEKNIKLYFSLSNKSKLLEIETNFRNTGKNRKLQIVFNFDEKINKLLSEDTIGLIEREIDPDYLLIEHMPAKQKKELKTNSYPIQRFASCFDAAIFTKGLNEVEIYKNSLKITLLRSIGIISNPKNKARMQPAGPPIECPDMQELGAYCSNIAFGFFDEKNELFKLADKFYYPFEAFLGEFNIKQKKYIIPPENSIFYGVHKIKGKFAPLFYNLKEKKFNI